MPRAHEVVLNSLDQAIIHFASDGDILFASARVGELPADLVDDLKESGKRRFSCPAFEESAQSSSFEVAGIVMRRFLADGSILEITSKRLADGSALCVISDVSDRERRTDELRQAVSRAEGENRSKDSFLANMSHELRTPLNAVLGYADLLVQDTSLTDLNQERVRRLRGAGWGLLTVLNDLIEYSRIAEGKIGIESSPFDIAEVVQDAISVAEPLAIEKALKFGAAMSGNLPKRLMGDPNRIRQILINLLNNAVKFTETGFVRLSVDWRAEISQTTNYLIMSVQDSGIGIPKSEQSFIFERYYQVNAHNDAVNRGAGLGLAICRQLVAKMNGTIQIQSVFGSGTTFAVKIPLEAAINHKARLQDERLAHGSILLADDVAISRDVTAELLRANDLRVDCVSNGEQAFRAASSRRYDLMILDLNMPVVDGFKAAEMMQPLRRANGFAIIGCSAGPLTGKQRGEIACHFDGFISKPFDPQKLRQLLWQYLSSDQGARACHIKKYQAPLGNLEDIIELVGREKALAGVNELLRYLDELNSIDLADTSNWRRVTDCAHSGVASAQLLGFKELQKVLTRLDNWSLSAAQGCSLARELRPRTFEMRSDIADLAMSRLQL